MLTCQELEQDYILMKDAVRSAGEIALQFFGQSPDSRNKDDGSPVSEADIAVDHHLQETLSVSGYGWLSEESEDTYSRLNDEKVWVVDPIDGTRAFLQSKPEWAVSVALVQNGVPVVAAVYNPATEEFFEAMAGQGARLNGRTISVSDTVVVDRSTLFAPKKIIDLIQRDQNIKLYKPKYVSSIAYRICLLSKGDYDGLMAKFGPSDWDIAAAHLILSEAGGQMTCFKDTQLKYNKEDIKHPNLLATNTALHNKLLMICEKYNF